MLWHGDGLEGGPQLLSNLCPRTGLAVADPTVDVLGHGGLGAGMGHPVNGSK